MQKKTQKIVGATKVSGLKILLPKDVSLKTLKEVTRFGQRKLRTARIGGRKPKGQKSKLLPAALETNIGKISTVLKSWDHIETQIGEKQYALTRRGDKVCFYFVKRDRNWQIITDLKTITRIAKLVGHRINPVFMRGVSGRKFCPLHITVSQKRRN